MDTCDIGIFGLGVMGQNLTLNLAGRGFSVVVYNRRDAGEEAVTDTFIASRCQRKLVIGAQNVISFVNALKSPRRVLIMVSAGTAVDEVLELLLPLLDSGDIVIDGGNSHFRDTARRIIRLEEQGLYYLGCGISGGGNGALKGPSIMPGGPYLAWEQVRYMFHSIAAKSPDGVPCCDWIGPAGAGHFVKMVHNGIEYALMQIIAEAYDLMKRMLSMSADEMYDVLMEWNTGSLHGYLLEITCAVLKMRDDDGQPLVEKISDHAGHKGSGKDTSIAALELGIPATSICAAINARLLSGMIKDRLHATQHFCSPKQLVVDRQTMLTSLQEAICCSQLIAYLQGFSVIMKASEEYRWDIELSLVARIWRGGCIIESEMLNHIAAALERANGNNLLLDSVLKEIIDQQQSGWRHTIIAAVQQGIPVPAISSALGYYDGLCSKRLPTNLIQAQRDYFGDHGFERYDASPGVIFHSTWGRATE